MTEDKWKDIISTVKQQFGLLQEEISELEDAPGTRHLLIFKTPMGEVKLERIVRAKVIDKKTSYSQRGGSGVDVQYIYADDEFSDYIEAYRYNENTDGWEKIEVERLYTL